MNITEMPVADIKKSESSELSEIHFFFNRMKLSYSVH